MSMSRPEAALALLLAACAGLAGCGPGPEQEAAAPAPPAAAGPVCDPDNGGLRLPEGFCALVVADHFGNLRHLALSPEGDLYAASRNRRLGLGSVVALRDVDGDGRADLTAQFDEEGGVGLALRGRALYLGTDTAVVRYRLAPGELVPTAPREVIVSGFAADQVHVSKTLAFDEAGGLYVAVGAPSNACQQADRVVGSPGLDPCPLLESSGGIWRLDADRPGQDYRRDGRRYASGIRHALAIDWEPTSGTLYAVQQGRDELDRLWPQHYTPEQSARLPGEELLRVLPETAYSWPYCFHDPDQGRLVEAPEYLAAEGQSGRCAGFPAPLAAFPAHSSPGDMVFYDGSQFPGRYRGGAFVALQGSYREDTGAPVGHEVVFVPFAEGQPAGPPEVFAAGFNAPAEAGAEARAFRPGGLAVGPDGSLYVSDSTQGRIWRVLYRPAPGNS